MLPVCALLLFLVISVGAQHDHDHGHDHGSDEAASVSVGATSETRSARVGDYEITMKNPALEPDTETSARLFLTWAQTNAPIANGKIVITIESANNPVLEINAEPDAKLAGSYSAKLPAIPAGETKIEARFTVGSNTETADFGVVDIHSKSETGTFGGLTDSLPMVLFAVAALTVLSLIGGLIWFGARRLKAVDGAAENNSQTVSI